MRIKPSALTQRPQGAPPRRMAVAAAGDLPTLEAVADAYKQGIALPILCGDIERIDAAARMRNIDLSPFEIIETDNDSQSVSIAVSLVRKGRADMLMKGLVRTADLLRAVLDQEHGLRRGGALSHVGVIDCPSLNRTLLCTDGMVTPAPDLNTKVKILRNAVAAAHGLGMENPAVAPLAATELINPDMPATLDAACLSMMNRRGQITGCVVDGPMALDVALSPDAAARKGVSSPVAGEADILLFHNVEAGNAAMKALTAVGGCMIGGVIVGASVPIVATSRGDSRESKLYSIAVGAILCQGGIPGEL